MAVKTGNIYTYDVMYTLSPTSAVPTGFDFDNYVEGQEVTVSDFLVLGNAITEMNLAPNAETSESAYITNKSVSTTVDSYNYVFSGSSELIADDAATKAMYDVQYFGKTGNDAMFTLLVIDLYNDVGATSGQFFAARLFRVSCAIPDITAEAAKKMLFDFELPAAKDPVIGVYDKANKTFYVDKTQQEPTAP